MSIDDSLLSILRCPTCRLGLSRSRSAIQCIECGASYRVIDGIPIFAPEEEQSDDVRINALKWTKFWSGLGWEESRDEYDRCMLPSVRRHLGPLRPGARFLEIGGGPSYLSFDLAGNGIETFTLDLDINILRTAKEHFARHGRRGYFIQADFHRIPFEDRLFAVSAGIGVLGHSSNIATAVVELLRVAETSGHTFQTVPHLSAMTLLTLSLRFGTVPRVPVIRTLIDRVHADLLRTKYMRYGYEESYTHGFLRRLFIDAGFRGVEVGFHDHEQTLFRRHEMLGPLFYRLMRWRVFGSQPFSDTAYVVATR